MRVGLAEGAQAGLLAPVESMAGLPVLIVDDNATNRRILAEQLHALGLAVTTADGARAALTELWRARAESRMFSLIIMDYHMPDMDGLQLAERMREFPGVVASSIMMLTSGGQAGDVAKCRELGLAAYVTKPLSQRALYQVVAQVIGAGMTSTGAFSPAVTKDAPVMMPVPTPEGAPKLAPLKVLLAEDNFVNQKLAVTMLQKRGHTVTVANDGVEACDRLERERFDVVLMDVHMPNMGGFEATAAIREREASTGEPRTPIVALTALAMTGDREKCLAAGMDGYLTKPISVSELMNQLLLLFPKGAPEHPASAAPVKPAPAFDLLQLRRNMDDDAEMMQDIVTAFLRDHATQLQTLRQALGGGDLALATRTAHTLKGLLLTLAAQEAADAALAMEKTLKAGDLATATAMLPALHTQLARLLPELQALANKAA
jgi:CheY-like chemotaxis protein